MDKLLYQAYEARRQTHAIKEVVERACRAVYPEPNVRFRIKAGPWYLPGPSQHLQITAFQTVGWSAGCCRRHPLCEIQIDRPKTQAGMYDYTKATALFLEKNQQPGNTRLIGHLQRHCPFLPKIEVTLDYETQ
jgi:hypothetical protein